MLVKICGLSNYIDTHNAIDSGADVLGFVMGGRILPVEIEPAAQKIRQIIKTVPSHIDSYLVTHLFDVDDMVDLANYVNATGIQVSEYIGVQELKYLRARTNKKIIKTIVVNDDAWLENLKSYERYCDYILTDTMHAGYIGGTGIVNDWTRCKNIIQLSKKPVYIAGGLTPDNVHGAIQATGPAGVDVCTGISSYSSCYLRKDRKDEQKIKIFIERAKSFQAVKKVKPVQVLQENF